MHHLNNIVATQSNSFIINKKTYYITTNTNITKSLHSTVDSTMTDFNLGLFESSEIGTHSICSGGAMAFFLLSSKVVVFMVMIIGRWKSNS